MKLISLHEFVFQETPEASPLPSPHPGNFAEASSNFVVKKQSPPSTSRLEHPEVAVVNDGVDNGVNNGVNNGVDAGVVIPSKSAAVSRDNHAAATNTAAYNNHGSNNNNSTSATNTNTSSNNNNNKSLDGEPVFGLSVADMRARLQAKKRADVREADNNRNFKEKYEIFQKL